jgi:uncharacterized protein (DUF885 family)
MSKQRTLMLIVASCIIARCNRTGTTVYTETAIAAESKRANDFFEASFQGELKRSPELQTYLGIKTDYDKWDEISGEKEQQELAITKRELRFLLDSINFASLDPQTRISYKLFQRNAENEINGFQFRHYDYPVNQMHGTQSQIPSFLINMHQITNRDDAEAYISRIGGIPKLLGQLVESLKVREKEGIVPPKFVFPMVIDDSRNVLKGRPFDSGPPSTLLEDFKSKIGRVEMGNSERDGLLKRFNKVLLDSMKPAYEKLIDFLTDQETRATTDDGAWKFPNGVAFYNFALGRTTTTNLTADEIHEIGLKEVARIHDEMRQIMSAVNFKGDLKDFFSYLKSENKFYYPNNEEGKSAYIDSAKTIIENMEARLDELFITKPKAAIVVKRVESFREKSAGKAFYQSPAPDGSRPGTYYANLYNTRNMPKFEMEALAYHEGIPGHHMDRSIAQQLTGIPQFRKFGSYTAYVEGWGLYCEFIPKEIGMYASPYSNYGRLAMELWRACRLVVDTGIHTRKWTREQGIEYYLTNTSGSERECERMVERHIVMPSQATAYKIGMLKILELRQKAKDRLGDRFDIREFHEVILTSGAVPLDVLEELVDNWVDQKLNA